MSKGGYRNGIRWNYNLVKQYFTDLGYDLISNKYINVDSKLIFKDKNNYYYFNSLYNIKIHIPEKFHTFNPYTIQNIKVWLKLNNKPFELISEIYEGCSKKLKWKCLKEECGETFEIDWDHVFGNDGCPFCTGHQVGISNCLATKKPDLAKEWHPTLNGDLTPYNVTCGSNKDVWWICKECGYEWPALIKNRSKSNGTGCPECNNSKGEKEIDDILIKYNWIKIRQEDFDNLLDKNNVRYYIPQKEFNDLVGLANRLLSYDFYLPKYNLLIEYQGEYHDQVILNYKNEPRKLAEKRFKKQQEHDKRKKNYTLTNNYNLLEIWYYDFDKIEEILNSELNKLDSN